MRAREGDHRAPGETAEDAPYADLLRSGPPSTRPAEPSSGSGAESEEAAPAPRITVVRPGELSERPYPGVLADPAPQVPAQRQSVPPWRPRLWRAVVFLLAVAFGVLVPGFALVGDATSRLASWEEGFPAEEETTLTLPPAEERWVWAPEGRAEELTCEATTPEGAALAVFDAYGQYHDGYDSAQRFATGGGEVVLTCSFAQEGGEAQAAEAPTLQLGEEPDLQYLPYAEASLLLTFGAIGLLAAVVVLAVLTQMTYVGGQIWRVIRGR